MKETYHVNSIKYSIVQFNNYKQSLKKDFFYELRKNLLDNIELDNEKLLKLKLEFLNDDNTIFKIIEHRTVFHCWDI